MPDLLAYLSVAPTSRAIAESVSSRASRPHPSRLLAQASPQPGASSGTAMAAGQYRFEGPIEGILISAGASAVMLILAARSWREVEWS